MRKIKKKVMEAFKSNNIKVRESIFFQNDNTKIGIVTGLRYVNKIKLKNIFKWILLKKGCVITIGENSTFEAKRISILENKNYIVKKKKITYF